MRTTCKNVDCGKPFNAKRAGAQYCSSRCRTAAHRMRQAPEPATFWYDGRKRRRNISDDLANHLLNIASNDDDGEPKTGRRYYYLALSHGFIAVDMTDSEGGKKSRAAGYKKVTDKLGALRMAGLLDWSMVLDLTRELDQWQTYSAPRNARAELRRSYDEDRWLGQEMFPILIVEKDTLEPVCKPIASRWQMPFASSRGYSSLKLQHDVAQMLNRPAPPRHGLACLIDPRSSRRRVWVHASASVTAYYHWPVQSLLPFFLIGCDPVHIESGTSRTYGLATVRSLDVDVSAAG